MARTSNQPESSDDLIAELARLIADDAQVSRPDLANPSEQNRSAVQLRAVDSPPSEKTQLTPAPAPKQTAPDHESPTLLLGDTGAKSPPEGPRQNSASAPRDTAPSQPRAASGSDPFAALNARASQVIAASEPARGASPSNRLNSRGPTLVHFDDEAAEDNPFTFTPDFNAPREEKKQRPAPSGDDQIADLISQHLAREAAEVEAGAYGRPAPAEEEAAEDPFANIAPQPKSPSAAAPEPKSDRFENTELYPAEDDSFVVAPVFGVAGAKNIDPAPKGNDPLADIENLIGEAVRDAWPNGQSSPRRHDEQDPNGAADAAEARIIAATASSASVSNASIGVTSAGYDYPDVDEVVPEESVRVEREIRPGRRRIVAWVGPSIAALVLLAIAAGLYWVFGLAPSTTSEVPPVLAADTTPTKMEPLVAATTTENSARSVALDGASAGFAQGTPEQLVSRDQSAGQAVADVSRVITPMDTEAGLANRKVRTVTVRPDGTIVSGDQALAGGELLPVDRPNVPALPAGSAVASPTLSVPSTAEPVPSVAVAETPVANSAEQPAVEDDPLSLLVTSSAAEAEAPVAEAVASTPENNVLRETTPANVVPPIPLPRPANRISSVATVAPTEAITEAAPARVVVSQPVVQRPAPVGNSQTVDLLGGGTVAQPVQAPQTASAAPVARVSAPAANVATTTSPGASTGAAYVQLASQRSEEAAQQTAATINQQYGSQLNGGKLEVQRVDLAERGIYYRVRMPSDSLDNANRVCAAIRSSGGDCFVRLD